MINISSDFLVKFNKVIDETSIISITDSDGIIKYVSHEFCKISGYKKEELLGKKHSILRHPDMSDIVFENMRKTITSGKTRKGIIKNKKKNGDYYRVKTIIVPIKDKDGIITEYMSVRTDVTKLVDSINEFNNYKKAIDSSGYFIKLDENGFIKYASKNFVNALGYKEKDIIGKPLLQQVYFENISTKTRENLEKLQNEIIGISYLEDEKQDLEEAIKNNKVWRGILKNRTRYGAFIRCNTTIMPILDLDKKIKEYIIIANDITDLEIAKQNLKTSYQKLKELDDKKTEFLNIASHELRTPMTSIKGYVSMMIDGDLGEVSDEIKTYLSKILDSSNRLINLINDMLDLSKLESSRIHFEDVKFDLIELLEDVIEDFKPLILEKSQNIKFTKNTDTLLVELDKNKIKQVVINLLSNAIKFTPNGGNIEVVCNSFEDYFIVDIIDDGIGISKQDQKLIFEKFGQVKNSLTRDINGTGLGLPIVKTIIERMGGKIFLESSEGKGSKFSFKLDKKIIY